RPNTHKAACRSAAPARPAALHRSSAVRRRAAEQKGGNGSVQPRSNSRKTKSLIEPTAWRSRGGRLPNRIPFAIPIPKKLHRAGAKTSAEVLISGVNYRQVSG